MSIVNSYNNWDPLEEVWLGDVYPASWYDHLSSEVRDCFYELTERTQQDLTIIENKLKSFGVSVCRPVYDKIDNYVDCNTQQLIKPEICPRDYYATVGQTLFGKRPVGHANPWKNHIDRYEKQGAVVDLILFNRTPRLCVNGACIARAGKDLYIDLGQQDNQSTDQLLKTFNQHYADKFKEYRVHILFNGGHTDGCFALLKPGVILSSRYFANYDSTFPNWKLLNVSDPEFYNHPHWRQRKLMSAAGSNNKWWLPSFSQSHAFNSHVLEHAQTWIGDYTETFFEINCLVVDKQNVIIPGENELVFRALEQMGITAHSVPFRTRTFWDGGMHCITLDIRRHGHCEDFFPERGEAKITIYD